MGKDFVDLTITMLKNKETDSNEMMKTIKKIQNEAEKKVNRYIDIDKEGLKGNFNELTILSSQIRNLQTQLDGISKQLKIETVH